ncbi:hypothetical protein D5R40_30635 [Okeania hirsuta]|uniref:Uncharacterized protein n=1 Tax=Okeania hirsuta TaxID=1458930 RepID=A0A3N6QZX9_9CYAN|nr:hypothetical protein D4Z78_06345 [Okeania hirsuta]RQH23210.1 hypothetical protein D5R40_30635 [Okeania hirsuta]
MIGFNQKLVTIVFPVNKKKIAFFIREKISIAIFFRLCQNILKKAKSNNTQKMLYVAILFEL